MHLLQTSIVNNSQTNILPFLCIDILKYNNKKNFKKCDKILLLFLSILLLNKTKNNWISWSVNGAKNTLAAPLVWEGTSSKWLLNINNQYLLISNKDNLKKGKTYFY